MGFPAADIFQAVMQHLFQDFGKVRTFLDDLKLCTAETFEDYIEHLEKILQVLLRNGLTLNIKKCEWAVQSTEYLGFVFTTNGIKPQQESKINSILQLEIPQDRKQVRHFVGLVNYYTNMWPNRAQILSPLTSLTSIKNPFKWTEEHTKAFNKMKSLVSQDVLLRFPDEKVPFDIYTDASEFQLGAIIKQAGNPIAFYSRKLTPPQRQYTTIEKELLSIVETLKEFKTILFGMKLNVFTDHKNLIHHNFTSDRVLRWRLLIEDFRPNISYVPGPTNIEADALSRLSIKENIDDSSNILHDAYIYNPAYDQVLFYPLDYEVLHANQQQDLELQDRVQRDQAKYRRLPFSNFDLICSENRGTTRIELPSQIHRAVVEWYHIMCGHIGASKLLATVSSHFHFPGIAAFIEDFCRTCQPCQVNKKVKGCGYLPAKDAESVPWMEVCVDLIGPWPINIRNQPVVFHALTCIDPATNLTELIRIDNATSHHVATKFENDWLSRYPRPVKCIHDGGPEFIGNTFQHCLRANGVLDSTISARNPQANAICERMHQVVSNSLRTFIE
ncbi:MAG: RNase H-like domain-containing protein, partial [bacterium]